MPEEPPKQTPEEEGGAAPEPPAKKKKWLKLVMIGAIAAVLVGGGIFGGMMLGNKDAGGGEEAEQMDVADEIVHDATTAATEESSGQGGSSKHGETTADKIGENMADMADTSNLLFKFEKPFMVNLSDPTMKWFVITSIEIKATTVKARYKIEQNIAPLRDATLTILSSKQKEEVLTVAGKDRLKRELKVRYEGLLEPNTIVDIYMPDIQIRRL